jgi:hypothetical protein
LVHTILGLLGKCSAGPPGPVFGVFREFLISFQIIDPHDSGIAASILLNLTPEERVWNPETFLGSNGCVDRTEELTQAYFEYISGLQTKYAQIQQRGWIVNYSRTSLETGAHYRPSNS